MLILSSEPGHRLIMIKFIGFGPELLLLLSVDQRCVVILTKNLLFDRLMAVTDDILSLLRVRGKVILKRLAVLLFERLIDAYTHALL